MKKIRFIVFGLIGIFIFLLTPHVNASSSLTKLNYLNPSNITIKNNVNDDTLRGTNFELPAGEYIFKWDLDLSINNYITFDFRLPDVNDTKTFEYSQSGKLLYSDLGESGTLDYISYISGEESGPVYDNSSTGFNFIITSAVIFDFNFDGLEFDNSYINSEYLVQDKIINLLKGNTKIISLLRIDECVVDGSFNPYQRVSYDPDFVAEDIEEANSLFDTFNLIRFGYDSSLQQGVVVFQFEKGEYIKYSYEFYDLNIKIINAENKSETLLKTLELVFNPNSSDKAVGYYVYNFTFDINNYYLINDIELLSIYLSNTTYNLDKTYDIKSSNSVSTLSNSSDDICYSTCGNVFSTTSKKIVKRVDITKEQMNQANGWYCILTIYDDKPTYAFNLVDENGNRIDNLISFDIDVHYYYDWWNKTVLNKDEYKFVHFDAGNIIDDKDAANWKFFLESYIPLADVFGDFTHLYDCSVWNNKFGLKQHYSEEEFNYVVAFDNMYELIEVRKLSVQYVVNENEVRIGSFSDDLSYWLYDEESDTMKGYKVDDNGNSYADSRIDINTPGEEVTDPDTGVVISPKFDKPEEVENNPKLNIPGNDWLIQLIENIKNFFLNMARIWKILICVFVSLFLFFIVYKVVKLIIKIFKK